MSGVNSGNLAVEWSKCSECSGACSYVKVGWRGRYGTVD